MRLGELEGIVGEEDGYSAESDAAVLLQGLDIAGRAARTDDGRTAGWSESPRAAGAGALRSSRGAAARRAHEPPGPGLDSLARGVSHPLRRHADRHLTRSALPQPGVHAHRRHRLRDDHHLHRRLRRHGRRQDADSHEDRGRQRAAREEDRAAQRLHRAVRRRHAREPDHLAAQGSGAAADDRAGALEHSASVHQVHHAPAVGKSAARVRGRAQSRTAACRSFPASAPSSIAARRSSSPAATASARRRCSGRCSRTRQTSLATPRTSIAARCDGATRSPSATCRRITPGRSRRA